MTRDRMVERVALMLSEKFEWTARGEPDLVYWREIARAALSASPVQELMEECKTNLERVMIRKPAGEYARGWNCGIEEALARIDDTLAKVRDQ